MDNVSTNTDISQDLIKSFFDSYLGAYWVNLEDHSVYIYKCEDHLKQILPSIDDCFTAMNSYVENYIHPEDRVFLSKMINGEFLRKKLANKREFAVIAREVIGDKERLLRFQVNKLGDGKHVAFGYMDVSDDEGGEQQNRAMIEALGSEYTSVYSVNLEKEEVSAYSMNPDIEKIFWNKYGQTMKYSEAARVYINYLVSREERKRMNDFCSVDNIRKQLQSKKSFDTVFKNAQGCYYEIKFVKSGSEELNNVVIGFKNRDEETRLNMMREEKARRDLAVISGLSDDFGCVLYVDLDTKEEIQYRHDPLFEQYIEGWSESENFEDRLARITVGFVHPDDKDMFVNATQMDKIISVVNKDAVYCVNFKALLEGEETFYQIKIVRDEQEDNHIIVGFRNIDEETRKEMDARERAEAANKAKTLFLSNMSHDIRTPMNAIIGFTDIAIKNLGDKDRITDCLNKVKTSGEHLLTLINDILDMSRIESGEVRLDNSPHDLEQSYKEIMPILINLAKSKDIHFEYDLENIENRYVMMDKLRINQIIINLVSNAIKYTDIGGNVRLKIRQNGVKNGFGIYEMTVSDNGIGMSREFVNIAFEAFSREKTSTVSHQEGTGLGLSIIKKIIDMMDGTVNVWSEVGKGTEFRVCIPLQLADEERCLQDKDSGEQRIEDDLTGKRILMVEDNELNREITAEVLREAGFEVEEAADGVFAVEMVKEKGPYYYDLILMDIQMPTMDGYEATRQIRKLTPQKHIPIIALSANAFEEDKKKALEAGMDAHQSKPLIGEKLIREMGTFL